MAVRSIRFAWIAVWVLAGLEPLAAQSTFRRGDANGDGVVDLSDGIFVLNFLFAGGTEPSCDAAADTNDDDGLDLSDGIAVFGYLFVGGDAPLPPGPEFCGLDPTPETLGCESYGGPGENCGVEPLDDFKATRLEVLTAEPQIGHPIDVRIELEAVLGSRPSADLGVSYHIIRKADLDDLSVTDEELKQFFVDAIVYENVVAGTNSFESRLVLPLEVDSPGEYYLFPLVDPLDQIVEFSEANNIPINSASEIPDGVRADLPEAVAVIVISDTLRDAPRIVLEEVESCGDAIRFEPRFSQGEENGFGFTWPVAVTVTGSETVSSVDLGVFLEIDCAEDPIPLQTWNTFDVEGEGDGEYRSRLTLSDLAPGSSTGVQLDSLILGGHNETIRCHVENEFRRRLAEDDRVNDCFGEKNPIENCVVPRFFDSGESGLAADILSQIRARLRIVVDPDGLVEDRVADEDDSLVVDFPIWVLYMDLFGLNEGYRGLELLSPLDGEELDNGRSDLSDSIVWSFDWSDVPNADAYQLVVTHVDDPMPVVDVDDLTDSHFTRVCEGCVTENLEGWSWRVRALIRGEWCPWTPERSFRVELIDTDDPGGEGLIAGDGAVAGGGAGALRLSRSFSQGFRNEAFGVSVNCEATASLGSSGARGRVTANVPVTLVGITVPFFSLVADAQAFPGNCDGPDDPRTNQNTGFELDVDFLGSTIFSRSEDFAYSETFTRSFSRSVERSASFWVVVIPVTVTAEASGSIGVDLTVGLNQVVGGNADPCTAEFPELVLTAEPFITVGASAEAFAGVRGVFGAGIRGSLTIVDERFTGEVSADLSFDVRGGVPFLVGTLRETVVNTLTGPNGSIEAFVEWSEPAMCSKRRWGIRWRYPCLKDKEESRTLASFWSFRLRQTLLNQSQSTEIRL